MSTPVVHGSSASHWLQGLTVKGAPLQSGTRPGGVPAAAPCDSAAISAQAFQLNQASGASTNAAAQVGHASELRGAHHHRHHNDRVEETPYVYEGIKAGRPHLQDAPAMAADKEGALLETPARTNTTDLRSVYAPIDASIAAGFPGGSVGHFSVTV